MRLRALLFAGWVYCLAQGPENVVVVVNQSSADSRAIAEYYARKRTVPRENICSIETTDREEITREIFETQILRPISSCLQNRGLKDKALYIATTMGVPLAITGSGGMNGDAASVDSELTLLYPTPTKDARSAVGFVANPFFGRRTARFVHPAFPIYLVTRLAAYDLATAKALIDRGLAATNRGRFVLDLKSTDNAAGNDWLRSAAVQLPSSRVLLEATNDVVYGAQDVIGYAAWGSNDPNRKKRFLGFQWLPGAIATEYVSTNGRTLLKPPEQWSPGMKFRGTMQSLAADYLQEGATGTSGHVYEPYLEATPRPNYLFPAYYAGRTLAESFYLSIPWLSWQNIVLGDPLCSLGRPAAGTPNRP